jgi:hypothetical protein
MGLTQAEDRSRTGGARSPPAPPGAPEAALLTHGVIRVQRLELNLRDTADPLHRFHQHDDQIAKGRRTRATVGRGLPDPLCTAPRGVEAEQAPGWLLRKRDRPS